MNNSTYEITRTKAPHPVIFMGSKFEQIIEKTCEYFQVEAVEIKKPGRLHKYLYARQIAMCLIVDNCPSLTLKTIGIHFGKKDHTTPIYSRQVVYEKLSSPWDDVLKTAYLEIIKRLPFEVKKIA